MHRLPLVTLLALTACATAPPPLTATATGTWTSAPVPPLQATPPAPRREDLPPSEPARLDEAERLLADGERLGRVATLLAAVPTSTRRRDLLIGQLAELCDDDATAVLAYEQVLARGEDGEVRLRRALALERLGRGAEAADDLRRLRDEGPRAVGAEVKPVRKLRPLRPSSR